MIGSILQMLAFNTVEDNIEQLTKVLSKGGTFKLDTGMLGNGVTKTINKVFGTKLDNSLGIEFAVNTAKRNVLGKTAGALIGAVGKYFFHPGFIAARMVAGMTFDYAKGKQEDNMLKNVMMLPQESEMYKIDERFNMVHNTQVGQMDYLNQSINAILSQGNLAGDLLDKAIGKL